MGCDIHSMLEIKTADWEGDDYVTRWRRNTAAIFRNPYFDEKKPVSVTNTPYSPDPLRSRNYRLFAMLADVRNGSGFAGVDTGDRVEPISEPKGVPADASPEWRAEVESWGGDLHSTSYLTLAELEAYDWDALVFERGYITEAEYVRLRGTNTTPPHGWSGGVSGGGIVTMTALEYESLSPEGLAQIHASYPASQDRWIPKGIYVQYQWAETRRETMGELAEAMAAMRNSAPKHWLPEEKRFTDPDLDAIRLMIGFDN